ncbi:MAG: hypothetical protein WEB63_12195 [Cucumibacter sp.]
MSIAGVFAPKRFSRLILSDAQNVARDPILAFAVVLAIVPAILLPVFREQMDQAALEGLGITGLSRYAGAVALALPAGLIGWVTGFLLLEDRDDGPLLAMEITPIGKSGFLAYRVAVAATIGFAVGFGTALAVIPGIGWGLAGLLGLFVGIETVTIAFVLLALAANKVEGLAVTKLTNIGSIVPLVAIIAWPGRYLAGVVPSFWIGEVLGLSSEAWLPLWLASLIGLGVHAGVAALTFAAASRRIG